MCRLFGLCSAPARVHADFWLVRAPDSLERQSRANPDGTGIGVFRTDGSPLVLRQPMAAWQDDAFALEARDLESAAFLAHVRFATAGGLSVADTHPFEQEGRLFAHNGVIRGLEAQPGSGDALRLVHGQTDSERFFALITAQIAGHHGDVGAGITAAARRVAAHLPLYSLNLILTTPDGLWALRYPDTNGLYILERGTGARRRREPLDHRDARHQVRARSDQLASAPCVVVASEPMDDDPGWRLMEPGELVQVSAGPRLSSTVALTASPAHQLRLSDLHPPAAASQGSR